jgi:serine protease Do
MGPALLGMQIAPLNADARSQYNIPESVKGGVVVQSVKGTSDAGDKGLQKGDVIVQAGDHEIASAGDLAAAVADWKKAGHALIPLGVRRAGQLSFVAVKVDG